MALQFVRTARLPFLGPPQTSGPPGPQSYTVGLAERLGITEDLSANQHISAYFAALAEGMSFDEAIGIVSTHIGHFGVSLTDSMAFSDGLGNDLATLDIERFFVPVTTCFDLTQAPYSCIHDATTTPLLATLTHNRDAIQQAIADCITNGGGKICISAGWNIPFTNTTGQNYGVYIHNAGAGVPIVFAGDGATLRQIRYTGTGDFYGIKIVGTGRVVFQGVTFSQRGMTTGVEQQHMVQVGDATTTPTDDVIFDRCRFVEGVGNLDSTGSTTKILGGDGLRLLGQSTDGGATGGMITRVQVDRCRFENCFRSGVGIQRGVKNLKITNSFFTGTGDQDIDMEPSSSGPVQQFTIVGNTLERTAGTTIAVTLTGQAGQDLHQHSVFAFNTLVGCSIQGLQMNNILIHGNSILCNRADGGTGDPCINLFRTVSNVVISNNYVYRYANMLAGPVIQIIQDDGTNPFNVKILDNNLIQETATMVLLLDSVFDSEVRGNRITSNLPAGTGAGTGNGVYVESGTGVSSGSIVGNKIIGLGLTPNMGIHLESNATYPLGKFFIRDNDIENALNGVAISVPASVTYLPIIDGNHFVSVTNLVPLVYMTGGNQGNCPQFVSNISPEGAITSPIGGLCMRSSNGAVYRKTTGTGNTGWVTP